MRSVDRSALNGVFYWPFANAGAGQPSVEQAVHTGDDASGDEASVRRITLPDVDLTDEGSVVAPAQHSAGDAGRTSTV
jgi:hypothetical protein